MQELKDYLKSNFKKQYTDETILPTLYFKPKGKAEARILIIGSEHGDKIHGTKAMIELMHRLKENPLEKTHFDFIPVIDTEGYPNNRTIIGNEGFGKPVYLDAGYSTNKMPEQIKELLEKIEPDYDFAIQLNTAFKEEQPLINGYYMIPQIKIDVNEDGKRKLNFNPRFKDLIGTLLNTLEEKNIQLQTESDKGYIGDGRVLVNPGLVFPGIEEHDAIELKTRNAFAMRCQKKGVNSLELVTLAHKITNEPNNEIIRAHKVVLDSLIRFYEL
ncbi:MAG: hypothetical protein L6266_05835 [Nanoarchaeota archaeon]|nr:hypothetical protein [Nanoarchaeota archaeon]